MKTKIIAIIMTMTYSLSGMSQFELYQYFDGADTAAYNSIIIEMDTSASNIWQVGPPQKNLFDGAYTAPNALVTDTVNFYPANNTSRFSFSIDPSYYTNGILALQWQQKLDMRPDKDGGIIEFSVDSGNTWQNAFNNPYIYNFYGHDPMNEDTLDTGEYAFSGTDSTWKDIWLCYDLTWLSYNNLITIRYTFQSDSMLGGAPENREGWLIDNMLAHVTILHTINESETTEYMKVSPNPSTGRVNIDTQKKNGHHIIEEMELIDISGKVVQRWGISPTKFFIDIDHHPNGIYFLKVKTNLKTESFKIVLEK